MKPFLAEEWSKPREGFLHLTINAKSKAERQI
jgi:hypothetical protein